MSTVDTSTVVVALTHEHTDFDALAALLAASMLFPNTVPVLPRQLNRNLEGFLALYGETLPFVTLEDLPRKRVDRSIIVDTQTVQPVRGMHAGTTAHIIDHHPMMRELPAGWTFFGEEVGATTTLLVEKLAESEHFINTVEATLLTLGIYEDTGGLSYETTTARDLRSAAWLLERGANLLVVDKFLHHPLTDEQRMLYQELADSSQPYQFHGHSVIIATATLPEPVEEISTLAHKLRDLYEPDGLFMLVAMGENVQLVARSTSDAIDVGKIATALGGGGHSRAAAALVRGGALHSTYETLVYLLQSQVQPTTTVGQIMSYGVPQTLAPTDTIALAAQRMQRYGFEGFPVVQDGQIVGMLTRREIDRAMHHGLDRHPVSRYMRAGEVHVTPDDSVETLRRIMTEQDWGQVPVLDPNNGAMLGIVTRTDLIKQWPSPESARMESLDDRIAECLPGALIDLLRQAGAAASEQNAPLYAVGGFVRDLLLGEPNYDVDLVVEGDAIALAQRLAVRLGGRVRSHRRFGTAKIILEDGARFAMNGSPSGVTDAGAWSLDFVTARTEFYEHPSALPTVERSSIKQDLHRRDFTINTLAIQLNPDRWGRLLDFFGGRKDLEDGVIRVLHSLSFIEDPTRILRAVRFEQRFRFRIDPRSEELIADALGMLDRVSAERLRHELELIVAEAEPELALCRLDELGVLGALQAELHCDAWFRQKAFELRRQLSLVQQGGDDLPPAMELGDHASAVLHLALLTVPLRREAVESFVNRFRLRREYRDVILDANALAGKRPALEVDEIRASTIVSLLDGSSDGARLLLRVATDSWLLRQRLDLYQRKLRHIRPALDGDDLRQMGIMPGLVYRQILHRLRTARLDGEVKTRADEESLVAHFVADRANS